MRTHHETKAGRPIGAQLFFCGALILFAGVAAAGCGGGGEKLTDRLLLARDDGISEIDLATDGERLLLPNPPESFLLEPAVSPDRQQIAYVRDVRPFVQPDEEQDFGMDIYVAAVDGSSPRLVLEHERPNDRFRSPAWLPDGRTLIVMLERTVRRELVYSIERVDVESGAHEAVVEGGFRPTVSPDGSRMVYVRQDGGVVQTLWQSNVDGSNPTMIAAPEDGLGSFFSPRFSPDGRMLAFGASEVSGVRRSSDSRRYMSSRGLRVGRGEASMALNGLPMDIWVMAEGGRPRRIADLQLDLPSVSWSGDGSRLFVFAGAGLFALDPAGGSERKVADGTFHGMVEWLSAPSASQD